MPCLIGLSFRPVLSARPFSCRYDRFTSPFPSRRSLAPTGSPHEVPRRRVIHSSPAYTLDERTSFSALPSCSNTSLFRALLGTAPSLPADLRSIGVLEDARIVSRVEAAGSHRPARAHRWRPDIDCRCSIGRVLSLHLSAVHLCRFPFVAHLSDRSLHLQSSSSYRSVLNNFSTLGMKLVRLTLDRSGAALRRMRASSLQVTATAWAAVQTCLMAAPTGWTALRSWHQARPVLHGVPAARRV
jgi:hypothetical protein